MNAGDLREVVNIESPTYIDGEQGKELSGWATVATNIPAGIRSVRAFEKLRGAQVAQETDFIIKMRYRTDVEADYRLVWGERLLYISAAIDPTQRRAELEIMASERSPSNG